MGDTMTWYDVHYHTLVCNYLAIEADSEEEAKKKLIELLENNPDWAREQLVHACEYTDPADVDTTDVLEVA